MRHPPAPQVSSITPLERLTRDLEFSDPETTSNLMKVPIICPYSSPRPLAFLVPSPAPDSGVTSGGAQCCCGQLIPLRRRPRPACPRAARGRMPCPAAPGPPEQRHGAGEGSGGVTRCLWRPPARPLGASHGLGLPGQGMGCGHFSGAERALGATSRPSGPLGCLGPASRSPTPRSRRPSRLHPGRREPRTLECQEG